MPRDPRTWMWAEAVELLDRAERLHRQFFRAMVAPSGQPTWEPPVDVFETAESLIILVALPGVPADRVRIGLETGTIVVTGERPIPAGVRAAEIRRLEIPHGRFQRRIELPPGRFEFAQQELANGCLMLQLHKL